MIFRPFTFSMVKVSQWEHHIHAITCDEGMWCHLTRIELFYFDDNFHRIAQWVLALKGGSTWRGIYTRRWSILFIFIGSWKRPLKGSTHRVTEAL